MRAQMLKWGNSLAVRIPKALAEEADFREGDQLEIGLVPGVGVQLQRVGKVPTLTQLVAQITPENRYQEISTGRAVGREDVEW